MKDLLLRRNIIAEGPGRRRQDVSNADNGYPTPTSKDIEAVGSLIPIGLAMLILMGMIAAFFKLVP